MNWYISAVSAHPIYMAIIQFAILGTFGEVVSKWIVNNKIYWPFTVKETIWKMIVWSILAVAIKYAFAGFKGYVQALVEHNLLPQAVTTNKFLKAFTLSTFTNLQFGIFMVVFHRVLDNVIVKVKNWKGLEKGIEVGMQEGLEKGKEEGMQEGEKKKQIEIAKISLKQGLNIETISIITGLTKEEIEELQREIENLKKQQGQIPRNRSVVIKKENYQLILVPTKED